MKDAKHLDKEATIAVLGLGFVGLPLSVMLAEKGFNVTGIDLDPRKLASINSFKSYIDDISSERLTNVMKANRFRVTDDFDRLEDVKNIIICVPTPLTADKNPDLTFVNSAGEEIQKRLKKGHLVVLESSTFPGTTKEVLLPILEKSGLKAGSDFFLANSPERIDPGNETYRVDQIPKVLGGITPACAEAAFDIYDKIYDKVVLVSSAEAAELTKLLENTFRFINISFINEIAMLCEHLGVDIWEVIGAASTKPYGFTPFYPGPGIGGHCIPVDPLYLQWKLGQYSTVSEFIHLSDEINERMVHYIVRYTKQLLQAEGKDASPKVLVYGVTYKKDVADTRDSKALEIIEEMKAEGIDVYYHDPLIPSLSIQNDLLTSSSLTDQLLSDMDAVVILTDHSSIPLQQILDHSSIIFDTRNITRGRNSTGKVVRLGEGKKI